MCRFVRSLFSVSSALRGAVRDRAIEAADRGDALAERRAVVADSTVVARDRGAGLGERSGKPAESGS